MKNVNQTVINNANTVTTPVCTTLEERLRKPEKKVREYYEKLWAAYCDSDDAFNEVACESARHAVKETLNLLGIKIEGVNA